MSLDQVSSLAEVKPPESAPKKSSTKKPPDIEAILREEIRALRELWMRILQWGVTVMIAAGSIIFFARRAIKEDLTLAGKLNVGEPLPLKLYLIGTAFLILLAYVFSVLSGLACSHSWTLRWLSELRARYRLKLTLPNERLATDSSRRPTLI